jgi:hypothetical protein
MNRTHTENEISAYVAGNTLATGLHAALADQEAEMDRLRYLLKEAVDTLRYISTQRRHFESIGVSGEKITRLDALNLANRLEGAADVWLEDHAVEADNLTGA